MSDYESRMGDEIAQFKNINVHDLPGIFHYWSNKFILPLHQKFGIGHANDLYQRHAERACLGAEGEGARIISLGSGNCDAEAELARRLLDAGHRNFCIDCLEINSTMLERGMKHARSLGVESHLRVQEGDFNAWKPAGRYDVVIANQVLHHVVELENLADAIYHAIQDSGCFLTSDMIGRNGHKRWPEALAALEPFFAELPPNLRYNHILGRQDSHFYDHDCSTVGFEGIRSQDILPILCERFNFELFIPFGNIVFPFVDRAPYGPNFDASRDWDRDFIDRVHARDEEGMLSGELKPCQIWLP